jgi:hypothetical protein
MNFKGLFWVGVPRIFVILLIVVCPLSAARAQSIISANALGYFDANFVVGSNLIANPLFADDNSVSNLFRNLPVGSYFIPWDRNSQRFEPTNHYTAAGWTFPLSTLVAPDGGFLVLPSAKLLTFVGQPWPVIPGPGCFTYPSGDSVYSWIPTTCCGFDCDLIGTPPFTDATTIMKWNRQTQAFGDSHIYYEGLGWIPTDPSALSPDESALFTIIDSFTARSPFAGFLSVGPVPTHRPSTIMVQSHRVGTNFTFRWASTSNAHYSVFSCSNLNTISWQVAQSGMATPTNDICTITVSSPDPHRFYRLQPNVTFSPAPILLGGQRGSNFFSFQFYAPASTNYVVERSSSFPTGLWQTVTNLNAGPSNIVAVVDHAATASVGYYRVRYGE